MTDVPESAGRHRPASRRARSAGARGDAVVLFPGCDPRGVLRRALSPDAPDWQTRPDALLFGWMLALAPGVSAAAAARAVLTSAEGRAASEHQLALLEGLERIAFGAPDLDPRRG